MSLTQYMSDLELLGVLVGPNTAENLLVENDGSLFQLFGLAAVDHQGGNAERYRVREGAPQDGWNRARFVLDAARELVSRGFAQSLRNRNALASPDAVREHLKTAIAHLQYEAFIVMFLDSQHRLIASRECFRGTLAQTSVYPREIVKLALEYGAGAVILCHNHPSGTVEPSMADRTLTELLSKALALVEVRTVDHFIIAGEQTYSFAEHGLI